MRRVALGLLALSIVLVAVARSDDAKHAGPLAKSACQAGAKCCAEATQCGEKGAKCCVAGAKVAQQAAKCCADDAQCCQQVANKSQGTAACCEAANSCPCAKQCGAASACTAGSACYEECEEEEVDCSACRTSDKIAHLETAAEHLHAAGLEAEANHILAGVQKLKRELLAQKLAELEHLQAQVRDLRRAVGSTRQVLIRVQIAEVSHARLRKAGFDLAGAGKARESLSGPEICEPDGIAGLVNALGQEKLVKVLAAPTVVTVDGRPVSYAVGAEVPTPVKQPDGTIGIELKMLGTQINALPKLLDDRKVRLWIHARTSEANPAHVVTLGGIAFPCLRSRELDTDCEFKLGRTAVIRGLFQEHIDRAGKRDQVELLVLITPELVNAQPPPTKPPQPYPAPRAPTAKAPPATLKK
jgi:hypothetical protein